MDFDFFFKMVLTCSFFGVTICLCIKWLVESYLDWVQVMTGIKVVTLQQMKDMEDSRLKQEFDDDTFTD
jgi:hypothetical protein